MELSEAWVVLDGQAIILRVLIILGAIASAIYGYFGLHDDLRNRDGTVPSLREEWERVFGLLAYFILGAVITGVVSFVALRILDSL